MATYIAQYAYNWILGIKDNGELDLKNESPLGKEYEKVVKDFFTNGMEFKDPVIKLGIKAPPGTRVAINGNIFIINNSGTLTINKPNYEIKTLKFFKDYKVELDKEATNNKIKNGLKLMDNALTTLLNESKATISINNNANAVNITPDLMVATTTSVQGENIENVITHPNTEELAGIKWIQ